MRIRITIVATLLLVAACGGQDGDAADTTLGGGADTVAEATTTTAATTTTSSEPETTTTTVEAATTTTTSVTAVEFPPGLETFTQGGEVWAVVLAGGAGDEPEMAAAEAAAEQAGYSTGPTDCDEGAAAALGLPSDQSWVTVSVYLESEADALLAQQAFAAQNVEGTVAQIRTYCLD
jgi:hypothetical protein